MKLGLAVFIVPDDETRVAGTHSRGYWYKQGMMMGALGLFILEVLIIGLVLLGTLS